jgi:hypothetical protein
MRMYKSSSVPILRSSRGKRKAVRTAPTLAKDAAYPAHFPRICLGKTSPAIRYGMALGPRLVITLKSMNPAKIKNIFVPPSEPIDRQARKIGGTADEPEHLQPYPPCPVGKHNSTHNTDEKETVDKGRSFTVIGRQTTRSDPLPYLFFSSK